MATTSCLASKLAQASARPFRAGGAPRLRAHVSRGVRSSLEEEFKKHVLGLSNDASSSSSSSHGRLKDLRASASGRLGGDHSSISPLPSSSSPAAGGDAQQPADSNHYEGSPPPPQQQQQQAYEPRAPHPSAGQPQPLPSDPHHPAQPHFSAQLPLAPEPYHPLEFFPASHLEMDWGPLPGAPEPWVPPAAISARARCFVILFGVGRVETEGIYSLRALAKDDGLPVDTIVAFENADDAARYATLLEATMEHVPTVWPIHWGELLAFCDAAGYRCRLEPGGSLLIPPDYNVGLTDWEKALKLKRGEYGLLDADPAPLGAAGPYFGGELSAQPPLGGWAGAGAGGAQYYDAAGWSAAGGPYYGEAEPHWVYESAPLEPADEEELLNAQLSAVIDSQLSSPNGLAAVKATLERLLPQE